MFDIYQKEAEYKMFLKGAAQLLEVYTNESSINKLHPIFSLIKIITDKLSLITFSESSSNARRELFPSHVLKEIIARAEIFSEEEPIFIEEDETISKKHKLYKERLTIDLASFPLIISPWNSGHVIRNIIEERSLANEMDEGVINVFYYPLCFAICEDGNHSQFARKLQGNAKTKLNKLVDLRALFSLVRFNGYSFTFHNNHKDYSYDYFVAKNEYEFYIGLLFEIGRMIYNSENPIIPKEIEKIVFEMWDKELW